nr:hypothetical protein [Tissierella sp.]
MKKNKISAYILLIFIMMLAITACADNRDKEPDKVPLEDPEENDDSGKEESPEDKGEILKEFKIIAEKMPAPDVLVNFIDENIEKLSEESAWAMVAELDTSLESNKQTYAERIFELDKNDELIKLSGTKQDFEMNKIEAIEDEKLRVEVEYLYNNMYKLTNIEGAFYPIVDYKAMEKYNKYLNEEGREYILIRSIDSDAKPMSDGGLTISFDELLKRISRTEEFLDAYPDSVKKQEMLEEYNNKVNAYIAGLPNTPIMDFETDILRDEVLKSYKEAIDKNNDFSNIVKEHLENIEENDNKVDDDIISDAYELIEKAVERFK